MSNDERNVIPIAFCDIVERCANGRVDQRLRLLPLKMAEAKLSVVFHDLGPAKR